MMGLAEFVRQRRKKVNLTQEEFAERAGVALTVVRKIEQGKTNLNMEKVNQVLKMFGHELAPVNSKELLEWDKETYDTRDYLLVSSQKPMKGNMYKREHFEQFGEGLGLTSKQINGTFNRILKNKPKAFNWVDQSFLSEDMKVAYKEVLSERYGKLEGSGSLQ